MYASELQEAWVRVLPVTWFRYFEKLIPSQVLPKMFCKGRGLGLSLDFLFTDKNLIRYINTQNLYRCEYFSAISYSIDLSISHDIPNILTLLGINRLVWYMF